MLHLTAAAHAEHRAERLRPVLGLRLVRHHFADRVLRLDLRDAHARAFARERTRNEHDQTVQPAYRLPVREKVGEAHGTDGA